MTRAYDDGAGVVNGGECNSVQSVTTPENGGDQNSIHTPHVVCGPHQVEDHSPLITHHRKDERTDNRESDQLGTCKTTGRHTIPKTGTLNEGTLEVVLFLLSHKRNTGLPASKGPRSIKRGIQG